MNSSRDKDQYLAKESKEYSPIVIKEEKDSQIYVEFESCQT